jgi:hypothetical protein
VKPVKFLIVLLLLQVAFSPLATNGSHELVDEELAVKEHLAKRLNQSL